MMNDEQRASDDLLAELGGAAGARRSGPERSNPGRDGSGPGDPDAASGGEPDRAGGRGGRGEPDGGGGEGTAADELASGQTSGDDDDEEADAQARRPLSFVVEMVILFAIALTIALLIKTFMVQPFFIPSGSMEDTLLVGDKVLVNKVVYDLRPIGRGDIVVFDGAGSWNPPTAPAPQSGNLLSRLYDDSLGRLINSIEGLFGTAPGQTDYIKRVIGIPGDHVACCNAKGQITVNGVALREQSYLMPGASPSTGRFNVVVPPGRLWVMGDNRVDSADSRLHDCGYSDPSASVSCAPYDRDGTVPESSVIGRAFMIVWPPSRIRILPVPSTFGQSALNRGNVAAGPDAGVPLRPAAPYLPLVGGFGMAIPLSIARRRLSRRLRSRRSDRLGIRRG